MCIHKQPLDEVSSDLLFDTTKTLAQWVRHSGTNQEKEAVAYVRQMLDSYGLRTTLLEHPALISYPLQSTLVADGQAIDCLGTAFSKSVSGLQAELVDLGFGEPEDYQAKDVSGKIALLNGLATPAAVYRAEQAGAIGQIFINDDHLHYMIASTVWGTPTPESAKRLPVTPSLSVTRASGDMLRKRLKKSAVHVQIENQIFTAWQQIPLLIAELDGTASTDFVLLSGHIDSWEVGAMDNGSGNATMMEVARILALHRGALHRGVRVAFWSGHSHGRYAGSTWYADNFWEELHDRCVAHVNVDSTGARGATDYGHFLANLELAPFGASIIEEHTGQRAEVSRMSRAGDMSFNGIGLPSMFMGVSHVPVRGDETDYVSQSCRKMFGDQMPWWWHTSDDTIDKIDPDVLVLDTKIYLSAVWRLCHNPRLPMDFRPVIADIQDRLHELQVAAGAHLDLGSTLQRVDHLAKLVGELCNESSVEAFNLQIKELSRLLIPITYTVAGRFEHDPASSMPHLPSLSDAERLPQLEGNAYHFLRTQLVRSQNRINFALRWAIHSFVTVGTGKTKRSS